MEKMRRFFWTIRLAFHLRRIGWSKSILSAYAWASDKCWQEYREGGFTPMGAIMEDASYG